MSLIGGAEKIDANEAKSIGLISEITKNENAFPLGYDKYINYTFNGNKEFIMNAIQYLTDNYGLLNLRAKNIKLRLLNNEIISENKSLIVF